MISSFASHTETPLVSIQLCCYSGDLHLLPRAVASIRRQNIPPQQLQVQIVFDGDPTADEYDQIAALDVPGHANLVRFAEPTGFHTTPRNKAFPQLWGFYVTFMDADNEIAEGHLDGLLQAIRFPEGPRPHFVYSRRKYVTDPPGNPKDSPSDGPSPLVQWTPEALGPLFASFKNNFIDAGDLLISRGALHLLGHLSGCVWNSDVRKAPDWEMLCRLAKHGFRGQAVDQVTNIYHWTGQNMQTTNKDGGVTYNLSSREIDILRKQGAFRE